MIFMLAKWLERIDHLTLEWCAAINISVLFFYGLLFLYEPPIIELGLHKLNIGFGLGFVIFSFLLTLFVAHFALFIYSSIGVVYCRIKKLRPYHGDFTKVCILFSVFSFFSLSSFLLVELDARAQYATAVDIANMLIERTDEYNKTNVHYPNTLEGPLGDSYLGFWDSETYKFRSFGRQFLIRGWNCHYYVHGKVDGRYIFDHPNSEVSCINSFDNFY